MGWFNHLDLMRCDPDRRQNRGNGDCVTRAMTPEDWQRSGKATLARSRLGMKGEGGVW
jgi:hypothetical protein